MGPSTDALKDYTSARGSREDKIVSLNKRRDLHGSDSVLALTTSIFALAGAYGSMILEHKGARRRRTRMGGLYGQTRR